MTRPASQCHGDLFPAVGPAGPPGPAGPAGPTGPTGPAGTGGLALQTGDIAWANLAQIVYSGGGPDGDLQAGAVLAPASGILSALAMVQTQGGPVGTVARLGVYSPAGALLAETGTIPAPGAGTKSALLTSPLAVVAGVVYYLVLWTNANGAAFLARSGNYVGSGPTLNFEAVNVPGLAGLPASVAGSLGNKTAQSVWVGGF